MGLWGTVSDCSNTTEHGYRVFRVLLDCACYQIARVAWHLLSPPPSLPPSLSPSLPHSLSLSLFLPLSLPPSPSLSLPLFLPLSLPPSPPPPLSYLSPSLPPSLSLSLSLPPSLPAPSLPPSLSPSLSLSLSLSPSPPPPAPISPSLSLPLSLQHTHIMGRVLYHTACDRSSGFAPEYCCQRELGTSSSEQPNPSTMNHKKDKQCSRHVPLYPPPLLVLTAACPNHRRCNAKYSRGMVVAPPPPSS